MSELTGIHPVVFWKHFLHLCEIPRPSYKEEKITAYLKAFGEALKLETIVDDVGNVIIRKPASKGMEDLMPVVLQSHVDMVCEKHSDVEHDFERDPIVAYKDGEWVTARGTTLGADNGVGVAITMAILEAEDIPHGPIEALFTVCEECGMGGAVALDRKILQGKILLNFDSEEEGVFCIGCAGGEQLRAHVRCDMRATPAGMVGFRLHVAGLRGGHSGADIHRNRGNAIKILNRLLWQAEKEYSLRLSDMQGGALPNAIPREAHAVVAIPEEKKDGFMRAVQVFSGAVRAEYAMTEPKLEIGWEVVEVPEKVLEKTVQSDVLKALYVCPNGVLRMSDSMPGLVETSNNLAHIHMEDEKCVIWAHVRSSIESAKKDVSNWVENAFTFPGSEVERFGDYPGWQPNIASEILRISKAVYQGKFGQAPKIAGIHAGLECGLLKEKYPEMDIISFGSTIQGAHSPHEKLHIPSVATLWDFTREILQHLPKG